MHIVEPFFQTARQWFTKFVRVQWPKRARTTEFQERITNHLEKNHHLHLFLFITRFKRFHPLFLSQEFSLIRFSISITESWKI